MSGLGDDIAFLSADVAHPEWSDDSDSGADDFVKHLGPTLRPLYLTDIPTMQNLLNNTGTGTDIIQFFGSPGAQHLDIHVRRQTPTRLKADFHTQVNQYSAIQMLAVKRFLYHNRAFVTILSPNIYEIDTLANILTDNSSYFLKYGPPVHPRVGND